MKNIELLIQKYAVSIICNKMTELDSSLYEDIVKYFIKNSISFIDLYSDSSNRYHDDFFKSKSFLLSLENEKILLNKWRSEFIEIKKYWDAEGIKYIFHKSNGKFPYLSGNLDIIVKEGDFKKAGDILKKLNYLDLRSIQEPDKEYYRKFDGDYAFVPIHLHKRVCWSVPYEDIDHLWEFHNISKSDPIVRYPSYDDSLLILFAHHFLEDHTIFLYDLLFLRECVSEAFINWDYIILTAQKLHWHHSLYSVLLIFNFLLINHFNERLIPDKIIKKASDYVKNKKWINIQLKILERKNNQLPISIPHLWIRMHTSLRELKDTSFGSLPFRIYQVLGNLFDGFIQLKLGLASQPNLLITFSGLDGSGKTTNINTLLNALKQCEIRNRYIWGRAGSMLITSFLLKTYRYYKTGKTNKNDISTDVIEKIAIPKNSTTLFIWRLLCSIDILIFYNRLRFKSLRGVLTVVDRYLEDNLVDIEHDSNSSERNRILYKILSSMIPKPEIKYFISTNPENICQRGVDDTIEIIKQKEKLYNDILLKNEFNIVDNNFDILTSSNKIIQQTLTSFYKKYPNKYKGYRIKSFRYK